MLLMRILKNLRYPLAGWVAGIVTVLALTAFWPTIFPGITNTEHYDSPPIAIPLILGTTFVIVTPIALLGGLIGSRLPREGGETEQMLVAIIVGALLSVPFVCGSLWFFTGG